MHNYSVVNKGDYAHKQTSNKVCVSRFIIIRKRQKRFVVLELENKRFDSLTGLTLQIDQYNGKGNFLGVANVNVKNLNKKGKFILEERIELHRACTDVFVKVLVAEYGEYRFCLDEGGSFATYNKKARNPKLNESEITKAVGKTGQSKFWHKFKAPGFIRACSVFALAIIIGVSAWQVIKYKENKNDFTLAGVTYELIEGYEGEDAPVIITGIKGLSDTLVINDTVEGHPVYGISQDAFKGNSLLKNLTVNGNILVDSYIFTNCPNLEKVVLNNVIQVPYGAFMDCVNLKSVEINNAEQINGYAFAGCASIRDISISSDDDERILKIGKNVFDVSENLNSIKVNQFIDFSEGVNVFDGFIGTKTLSLKNFNFAPFEHSEDYALHRLDELFGSTYSSVEELHIEYTDAIPDNFASNIGDELKSVVIDNLGSTILGSYAFANCSNLTKVDVPKPFTEVGGYAFKNTVIEEFSAVALTKIGEGAFENCEKLLEFDLSTNNLITEIPAFAFKGTTSLTNFHISSEITALGEGCFKDSGIEQIVFEPEIQLDIISPSLFSGCYKLNQISIPQTVKSIGNNAFSGCSSLTEIALPSELERLGNNAFDNTKLTKFTVPDTVTYIGSSLLYGNTDLTELKVPFFGETIDSSASVGYLFGASVYYEHIDLVSPNLTKVTLTLDDEVSDGAFAYCEKLKEVTLPENAVKIGEQAFSCCYNLRQITIPEPVTEIGFSAFENCYKLYEITNLSNYSISRGDNIAQYALVVYGKNDSKLQAQTINGYKFLRASDSWYLVDIPVNQTLSLPDRVDGYKYSIPSRFFFNVDASSVTVPSEMNTICDEAFMESSIRKITFNGTQAIFGRRLFANNYSLTEVDLSTAGLTSIGEGYFENCVALKTVSIPDEVYYIGSRAFSANSELENINVPDDLEGIGDSAFNNCISLRSFDASDIMLYAIGKSAFFGCSSLSTVKLPSSLRDIGEGAFMNCGAITELTVPNEVTFIGSGFIQGCSSLSKLTVPYVGPSLSEPAVMAYFYGGNTSTNHRYLPIPSEVTVTKATQLANRVFYESFTLKTVTLNAVTSVSERAFSECEQLETVNLPTTLETIEPNAFSWCRRLKTIKIPDSVSSIDGYAFANSVITEIKLPTNLSYLGTCAFSGCNYLDCVIIPSGLSTYATVESDAFSGCYKLNQVYVLNGQNVYRLGTTFGGVAQNAVVVDTTESAERLKKATVGDYEVKYRTNVCAVVGYNGYYRDITLSSITVDGVKYDNYYVITKVFDNISVDKVTINASSVELYSGAFAGYIGTLNLSKCNAILCERAFAGNIGNLILGNASKKVASTGFHSYFDVLYYGSYDTWREDTEGISVSVEPMYFYSECIHEYGANLWNFSEYGNVNFNLSDVYARVTKQPTCQELGVGEYYCEKCDYVETYEILRKGHNYVDYVCADCNEIFEISVTQITYPAVTRNLLTVTNDEENPFATFNQEVTPYGIQSTNVLENSTSTISFTANYNLKLSCKYYLSGDNVGKIIIKLNGEEILSDTESATSLCSVSLKKGDVLSITFERNDAIATNSYLRLSNLKVSKPE